MAGQHDLNNTAGNSQDSKREGEKKSKRNHGVFPCEKCGRTYVRKDSLQRHTLWECGKDPMFQCPFCPQKCKRKSHHIRHIQRQHKDMLELMGAKPASALSPNLPQKEAASTPEDTPAKIPKLMKEGQIKKRTIYVSANS